MRPPRPGPNPPHPDGYRYARGAELDATVIQAAKDALWSPMGTQHKLVHDGRDYVILLEWHYHPEGGPLRPWGWHKGASVFVRKESSVIPLRLRALQIALEEAEHWGGAPVPKERVALYLSGCDRDGAPQLGRWLASQRLDGKPVSFCAAAVGWCEAQAAIGDDERPPHRAGAKEIMRDAIAGRRGGVWVPVSEVRQGYRPPPGSAVVYWRGAPDAWTGHVERLIEATDAGYRSVGANERGGRWYVDVDPVSYDHPRLLGFCVEDADWAPLIPVDESEAGAPPKPDDYDEADVDVDVILARGATVAPNWEAMRAERDRLILEAK